MLKTAIQKVVDGMDLSEKEMEGAMDVIMSGQATPAQIGAFITALRLKGETIEEITGAARVMRRKATKIGFDSSAVSIDRDDINLDLETVVDTCGTGGDGTNTFNVSTTTAFVVAGCGLRVAKHGNREVGGKSRCASGSGGRVPQSGGNRFSLCTRLAWGHEVCHWPPARDRHPQHF
jgi:anthranilate phosphoribosyltransferase